MAEETIVQSDELDSEVYWKGIKRDTDLWFKSQIDGLKKAKPYLESLGLDAEEIIWQFEYRSEYNTKRLTNALIRFISDSLLVQAKKSMLEYREKEMIEDLTTIDDVLSIDFKAKDTIDFNFLVEEAKKDTKILGVDCSNYEIGLTFDLLETYMFNLEKLLSFVKEVK